MSVDPPQHASTPVSVACPTCQTSVEWSPESTWRPFCSDRCRLIDLGEWFNEQHRIADDTDVAPDA
ncbi:MAG: DNA gyrase inhibitor YacG [Gammaproteobacteria bacterium]|nr:DNA gyrase inhibitor YacG [Gammaproteobacteria bacterium]